MIDFVIPFIHFNPRPPCGGRRNTAFAVPSLTVFQSTSPVWRTTDTDKQYQREQLVFQSTSPVWRTTKSRRLPFPFQAPYFNPRPPCGGRQQYCTNRMQHHFTQTGCSAYFFFITSFSHRLYHFAAAVFPARMHRDFYVRFTFAESDYQRLGYVKR